MMTSLEIGALIASVDKIQADAAASAAAANATADAAKQAVEDIAAARRTAASAVQQARIRAGAEVLDAMRRLTDEVRAARGEAATAVATGNRPLEAWLRYRRIRAANSGTWTTLSQRYMSVTGSHRAPPGDWGPDVQQQFSGGVPTPVPAESFTDFLTAACLRMEQQIHADSAAATSRQIEEQESRP